MSTAPTEKEKLHVIKTMMTKTNKQVEKLYEKGRLIIDESADSRRRELIHTSLEICSRILEHVKANLTKTSISGLQKMYATLVQQANLLSEGFNKKETKQWEELPDEELAKLAGEETEDDTKNED